MDTIKSLTPKFIRQFYSKKKQRLTTFVEGCHDLKRYKKHALFVMVPKDEDKVKSALIFHAHSLEKGLSHPNFRPNFGKLALTYLSENLLMFKKQKFDTNSFEFQNAISVLKSYKKMHEEEGIETPFFDDMFNSNLYQNGSLPSGSVEIHNGGLNERKNQTLSDIQASRHSVREFSKSKVDFEKVKKAIIQTGSAPTVCNRQSWKIFVTENNATLEKLLELQGGYKGYDIPPMLAVVTTSLKGFRGPFERNEPFVDGGIVLMNFLLSLTDNNLASCTLNAMLTEKKLNSIRKLMTIPDSSVIIALVLIGNYKNEYQIASSLRKNYSEQMVLVN